MRLTGVLLFLFFIPSGLGGMTDNELLEHIQKLTCDFFWYEASPSTGLIRDHAINEPYVVDGNAQSSTASTGFGLTALCIAHSRKHLSYQDVYDRIRTTLAFFNSGSVQGRDGFYYHFVNISDGSRLFSCELSSIDTALFIAGALFAGQYFKGTEIETLADSLYRKVNWQWMCNGDDTVNMAWYPGTGFTGAEWDGYNEDVILDFLAIGSPTYPPNNSPNCWVNMNRPVGSFAGYTMIKTDPENALFVHQYPQCWLDLRKARYAGVNYFTNSRKNAIANRIFSSTNQNPDHLLWGASATDNPFGGYSAYGAPPGSDITNDGTIAPVGAGGSVMLLPDESIQALRHMYTNYRSIFWGGNVFYGKYGFSCYINARVSMCGGTVIGIDQGAIALSIENYLTGMVWDVFMQIPYMQDALSRMGFAAESDITRPLPVTDLACFGNLLKWTAPSDDSGVVKKYTLRYSPKRIINMAEWHDAVELTNSQVPKAAGSAESLLLNFIPAGEYYFALRSEDSAGNRSLLSNPTEKVVVHEAKDRLLQNFPNPASGSTTLRYILSETADVRLRLYSLSGKLLKEWDRPASAAGYHQFDWDLQTDGALLPPGLYRLVMAKGKKNISEIKIAVVR